MSGDGQLNQEGAKDTNLSSAIGTSIGDNSPLQYAQISEIQSPPHEFSNLITFLKALNFHHVALFVEDPIVSQGLSLSDFFEIVNARWYRDSITNNNLTQYVNMTANDFNTIVIEAFCKCSEILFLNREPSPPSLEERAYIENLSADESVKPFIKEKAVYKLLTPDATNFILSLGLLSPLPEFISGNELLKGVGHILKKLVRQSGDTEDFFRRTLERALISYNLNEAREVLDLDVSRNKQPISNEEFCDLFDYASLRIDGDLEKLDLKLSKANRMARCSQNRFHDRNGGDINVVVKILHHLTKSSDYYYNNFHHEARANWIQSLKSKHTIFYIGVSDSLSYINWPHSPFFTKCLNARNSNR